MKKNRKVLPKEFLGAFPAGHRLSAREFIDIEFSQRLLKRVLKSNYEDKEAVHLLLYIAKFNNEFHKNVISKTDPLHKTQVLRRSLYSRENSRNRDISSIARDGLVSYETITLYESIRNRCAIADEREKNLRDPQEASIYGTGAWQRFDEVEDTIIEAIDSQKP